MRARYAISMRSPRYPWAPIAANVTDSLITSYVRDVVVHAIAATTGGYEVALELDRPSHEDALEEIGAMLETLGFTAVKVVITEVADAALLGPASGLLTFIGVGAKTKNLVLALVTAGIGTAVGVVVAKLFSIPIGGCVATRQGDTWRIDQIGLPWRGTPGAS